MQSVKRRIEAAEMVATARSEKRAANGMTEEEITFIRETNEGDRLAHMEKRTPEQSARLAELEAKYQCDYVAVRIWLDALVE